MAAAPGLRRTVYRLYTQKKRASTTMVATLLPDVAVPRAFGLGEKETANALAASGNGFQGWATTRSGYLDQLEGVKRQNDATWPVPAVTAG